MDKMKTVVNTGPTDETQDKVHQMKCIQIEKS
jgi:hypothetical protein